MAYIRAKKKRRKKYYYVVEGKRGEKGKVKQKIIRYLGTVENILRVFKFWDEHR